MTDYAGDMTPREAWDILAANPSCEIMVAGGALRRSMLIGDTQTDRNTGLAAGVPVALVTFGPEGRGVERLKPEALLNGYGELGDVVGRWIG